MRKLKFVTRKLCVANKQIEILKERGFRTSVSSDPMTSADVGAKKEEEGDKESEADQR